MSRDAEGPRRSYITERCNCRLDVNFWPAPADRSTGVRWSMSATRAYDAGRSRELISQRHPSSPKPPAIHYTVRMSGETRIDPISPVAVPGRSTQNALETMQAEQAYIVPVSSSANLSASAVLRYSGEHQVTALVRPIASATQEQE